jgi:hypothetical protein
MRAEIEQAKVDARAKIEGLVTGSKVLLFMKGTKVRPMEHPRVSSTSA